MRELARARWFCGALFFPGGQLRAGCAMGERMKKIERLTDEQWSSIQAHIDGVLPAQTEQVPHEEVRSTVREMWNRMGGAANVVLIAPSPMCGAVWSIYLKGILGDDQLGGQLCGQLYDQLDDQLGGQLCGQLYDQLDGQLHGQLCGQLYDQVHGQLHGQLYDQVHDQLYGQLDDQVHGQLDDQLHGQLDDQVRSASYTSIFWRFWSAYYECGSIAGVRFDQDIFRAWRAWCRCVPHVFSWKKSPVVSANPVEVHWDQRGERLSNDNGPALLFSDNWAVWVISGVRVDEQIVMRPSSQSVTQIREEQNEEVKRIRIERFGWQRYLHEIGATVADERLNDVEGTREALMKTPDGMVSFVGRCRSTGRVYFLEVDPSVETCEQAQRWLRNGRDMNLIGAS